MLVFIFTFHNPFLGFVRAGSCRPVLEQDGEQYDDSARHSGRDQAHRLP